MLVTLRRDCLGRFAQHPRISNGHGCNGHGRPLKAPLIPVGRWMKKENPTDGLDLAKKLEPARLTFG